MLNIYSYGTIYSRRCHTGNYNTLFWSNTFNSNIYFIDDWWWWWFNVVVMMIVARCGASCDTLSIHGMARLWTAVELCGLPQTRRRLRRRQSHQRAAPRSLLVRCIHDVVSLHIHHSFVSLSLSWCSAGIGRTGTFIVVHTVFEEYRYYHEKQLPLTFNLIDVLVKIRAARPGLVQTKVYFLFYFFFFCNSNFKLRLGSITILLSSIMWSNCWI